MKRTIIYLLAISIFAACNSQNDNASFLASYSSTPTHSPQPKEVKHVKKTGIVLPLDKNDFIEQPKVNIWSSHSFPRDTLYTLDFGEKVIIRSEQGDYFYLSPSKDTSVRGYLLKGWIIIDDLNTTIKESYAFKRIDNKLMKETGLSSLGQNEPVSLSLLLSKYYNHDEDTVTLEDIEEQLKKIEDRSRKDSTQLSR